MTSDNFKDFVTRLYIYYSKERMIQGRNADDRLFLWYERVENIPDESLEWILKNITNDFETVPQNIPKTIHHYWRLYLDTFPEKKALAHEQKTFCPHCCDGLLFFDHQPDGYPFVIEKVARCGYCNNNRSTSIPSLTIPQAEKMGLKYKHVERVII